MRDFKMKRVCLILVAIIGFASWTFGQNIVYNVNKSDRENDGLKCRVKKVIINQETTEYDINGNLTRKSNVIGGSRYQYIFDANGRKIEKYTHHNYNRDPVSYRTVYQYSEKGNIVKETRYRIDSNNKEHYLDYCTYNIQGYPIEKYDGNNAHFTYYEYDNNGNLIEQKNYDYNKSFRGKITYKYNYNNRIHSASYYDKNQELIKLKVFLATNEDPLSYKEEIVSEKRYYVTTYSYDSCGNWITMFNSSVSSISRNIEYY